MACDPPRRASPAAAPGLVPFRQDWREAFQNLVAKLRPAFPADALFHHIGSTAVPGLAAKDVIDIQVSVASLEFLDAALLARRGFVERLGLADHPPAGGTVPAEELRKRFFNCVNRPANVHVRIRGRYNQRYPLLCRDYLRAHPVTAASYQLIKARLMVWFPGDANRYYDIKDPLFDVIMDGAEAWAQLTGWCVPGPDF